ncbi:MAG TPA: hypothetical protein PLL30_15800 [Candidatus Krumholzibacteria bacterium]|nr:hypothetical protein [Candidatus Krumholzibacteria bacterium]HPD73234.1 hypothetical protein [Candidatus Krumholzibacteria bacterium]HRY40196.1 hypothetical protein [Candidatus Krumholzibacteria bacterium]
MTPRMVLCLGQLLLSVPAVAVPLQAVYDRAPAQGGYDRYLTLETGVVYTGGLLVGPTWDDDRQVFLDDELGLDVMIEGRGAVLDLQGQQICISFCDHRLDIVDCVVTHGGIRFRGELSPGEDRSPAGSVRYCTFWQPDDYAVRLQGAGDGIVLERNIVVDAVDTGLDYVIWSGVAGPHLPTGLAFGLSVQIATYGFPDVRDNWTWFADPQDNAEQIHHFCFL